MSRTVATPTRLQFRHLFPGSGGTCWDADRLDLGRVGMTPESRFMSTDFGRELAGRGAIETNPR